MIKPLPEGKTGMQSSRSANKGITAAGRLSRFGDWAELSAMCQSGTVPGGRPFFAGEHVYDRMALVRQAINDIRVGWDNYPDFMQDLREYLSDSAKTADEKQSLDVRFEQLLSSSKEWLPKQAEEAEDDYSALRLYTSNIGYRSIFRLINTAFREDNLTSDRLIMRRAAFVVELLTIDLFNYRERSPAADRYEGTVYRGMCVSAHQLKMLSKASVGPVKERYLSVPLAMVSTSTNQEKAMVFAMAESARNPDLYPLIWKIDIASLDHESLHLYRDKFPSSIVTSLCAVPIARLSDYPEEGEVLLRGPFFQVVWFDKRSVHGSDKPLYEVEALMLNSNRDHISALASNQGDDRKARDLFRALVTIRRSALCAEHALERGALSDLESYRSIISENRKLVESL
jgi:hypothetical protein